MLKEKEFPAEKLKDFKGMYLYTGYIIDQFRFRVYVPTTIFDPQAALIRVYKPKHPGKQLPDCPEPVIARESIHLSSMPKWNVQYQCLELSRRDERALRKTLKDLEKRVKE